MAKKMHISQQQWSRYECGKSKITIDSLLTIILILDINPNNMISFILNEIYEVQQ